MRLFTAFACSLYIALVPLKASALGLGDIELESALNQPFAAEIPLESVGTADLAELTVSLASAETFARYGLDKPAYLSGFQFRVDSSTPGRPVVRITSVNAVSEPFVTLLLDVKWASGRLLREYTVLLDPPVFDAAPSASQVTPATAAPQPAVETPPRAAAAPTPTLADPDPVPAEPTADSADPASTEPAVEAAAEPERAPTPAFDSSPTAAGTYTAQRGDTLWRIAERSRTGTGLSNNQMMLAIYQANPEAFLGNINGLKAGAILRIPAASEAAGLSAREANAEVQNQHAAWSGGMSASAGAAPEPEARLQLVAPGSADAADGAAEQGAGGTGDAALRARVNELESELSESQRLLQLRDTELEALQQRVAELEQEAPTDEFMADDAAAVTEDGLDSGFDEELADGDTTIELSDEFLEEDADVLVDEIDEPTPSPFADEAGGAEELADDSADADESVAAAPAPAPVEEPSLIGQLLGSYWLWGAIGLAVVALLVVLRRRGAEEDPDATGMWADETDVADSTAQDFSDLPSFENSIVVDETDQEEDLDQELAEDAAAPAEIEEPEAEPDYGTVFDEAAEEAALQAGDEEPDDSALDQLDQADAVAGRDDEPETALEKTISTGAPLNLDQADPIAEAEFHMAYGLYDQAAELLAKALEDEPDNRAYRVKLIEVYFVWENKDGFLEQSGLLRDAITDEADADWNKVLILGKQLCPDSELFSGDQAAVASPDGMDLELGDAAGTEVDFTLAGNDVPTLDESDLDVSGGAEGDSVDEGDEEEALDFDLGASDDDEAEISLDLSDAGDLDVDLDDAALEPLDLDDDTAATTESPTVDAPGSEGATVEADMGAETMESPTLDFDLGSDAGSTMESPTLEMADTAGATSEMPALDGLDDIDSDVESDSDSGDNADDGPGTDNLASADLSDPTSLEVDLSGLADLPMDEVEGDADGDAESDDEVDIDSTLNQLDNTGELLTPEDMSRTIAGESLDDDEDIADDDATLLASTSEMQNLADELSPAGDTVQQPDLGASVDGDTAEQPEIPSSTDNLEETGNVDLDAETQIAAMPGDATMTEVGTKLDLARAYIDMGDPDGARSILNEVLDEGGDTQQQEARQLLEELGD